MKEPQNETDEGPDAPPSERELEEAALLRDALVDPRAPNEQAELARALALAHAPRPLAAEENEELVARALTQGVRSLEAARARRARRGRWVAIGTSALLLAAAALLFATHRGAGGPMVASNEPELLCARSLQPLFHEPFAVRGGTSARVDRIVSARAGDFRENLFASWDVR